MEFTILSSISNRNQFGMWLLYMCSLELYRVNEYRKIISAYPLTPLIINIILYYLKSMCNNWNFYRKLEIKKKENPIKRH